MGVVDERLLRVQIVEVVCFVVKRLDHKSTNVVRSPRSQ